MSGWISTFANLSLPPGRTEQISHISHSHFNQRHGSCFSLEWVAYIHVAKGEQELKINLTVQVGR